MPNPINSQRLQHSFSYSCVCHKHTRNFFARVMSMFVSYLQYYELQKCCKSGDVILFDYIMKCHITTKLFTIEPNESISGNGALVLKLNLWFVVSARHQIRMFGDCQTVVLSWPLNSDSNASVQFSYFYSEYKLEKTSFLTFYVIIKCSYNCS